MNKRVTLVGYEVWLSLVERYVRDVEVVGSNPVTSIKKNKASVDFGILVFLFVLPLVLLVLNFVLNFYIYVLEILLYDCFMWTLILKVSWGYR